MSTQDDIVACIRDYPGIHLRGIERTLGLSSALVHYHVRELSKRKLIEAETLHGYVRYFVPKTGRAKVSEADRGLLALLREEGPANLVLLLLDEGPVAHGDLVGRTNLAKSTVSYHLAKLADAGVVLRNPDGILRLSDEKRIRRVLLAHQPTPDLRAKFERLWDDFYGT